MTGPVKSEVRESDTVVLSVKLASGRFETEMRVPLFGDPEERDLAMQRWAEVVSMGFKVGAQAVDVSWDPRKARK